MRFVAPVVAALLVGGVVVPVAPAAAAPMAVATPATTTQVDDSDLGSWVYSDGWTHAAGEGWTAQNFQGSESFSNTPGARATLTFTGTGIDLVGTLGPNAGRARAWVDCGEPITLDMYAPAKRYGLTVATFPGLPAGTHTLTMEVLGTRNGASSDTYGILDYARIVDDPALADPSNRWEGAEPWHTDDPVELRRAGCGSQSELVSQLKLRSTGGWFDAGDAWGAVNGHSAELTNGRAAPGPVVIAGDVREAATLGLNSGRPATLDLALPDAPRSLLLWVAADSSVGGSAQVAAADQETGDFLPTEVLSGEPGAWTRDSSTSEAIVLRNGQHKVLVVDLTGPGGLAAVDEVQLWASSTDAQPAELVILQGRVSDLSAARLAAEVGSGDAPRNDDRVSARADAFSRGAVVLSRVLADAAQPAWTPDGKPVAMSFGRSLTVSGEPLSSDAMSITLPPAAWPNSTSTVQVKFETAQRCRSLTASVGLDDSTPARSGATVSVSVLGDGEPLAMKHNGLWASVDFPGVSRSPVKDGQIREELAAELRVAKSGALASSSAVTALVAAQADALAATANNRSMAVTSYPIAHPLVIGSGYNGDRVGGQFAPADLESIDIHGRLRQEVNATALDPFEPYPFSVDLMTDRMREHMRTVATSTLTDVAHLASPLVSTVELVISGTPGAVVAIDEAGLDCVSTESGPRRVMPLWSQIGLPPAFLPSPVGADGTALWQLGTHPLWWDFACPAGPSVAGLHYTANRTRLTSYTNAARGGVIPGAMDVVRVDEVSTATLPACALPADQRESAFTEWALAPGSNVAPDDETYDIAFRHTVDPTADRVSVINGDWTEELRVWAANAGYETLDDPVTFTIWAALAPFDLPAAIVLNPFTQHTLPLSAQLAVGGALFGGAELVAKLPAASQAGARLTFLTAEQAANEAAAGRIALLERDGADLAIPLAGGTADLALETKAAGVISTDTVSAGIPSTKWGPGWVDESFGEGRICTRDVGSFCRPRRVLESYPGPEWDGELDEDGFIREEAPDFPEGDDVEVGEEPEPEQPQTEAHIGQAPNGPPAAGFEAMFPLNPSRSLVGETAEFENSFDDLVQIAWQTTVDFAEQMGNVNANEIALQVAGSGRVNTVALRTSSEPLYFYSTLPPSVVLGSEGNVGVGLRANSQALANYHGGIGDEVNLMHSMGAERERSLFVLGSPDSRLPVRALSGTNAARGYYIYETSFAGGFNQLKSLRQAGLPAPYREISENVGIVTRYDVAVPGGVPASAITGWKKIDVFPGTDAFEVTASSSDITAADREGWSFAGSTTHDWAVFDHYTPSFVGEVLTVEKPPVSLITRARQHWGVLVFTKQSGWTFFADKQDVLTAAYLEGAGFVQGSWANVPDLTMWVPKGGGDYTVAVNTGFIPAD